MTTSSASDSTPCPDPDCVDEHGTRSLAEPETDGDTSYFACPRCGYSFGWQQPRPYPSSDCPVGIPEPIRRAATPPPAGRTLLPLTPIRRTP